jgi:stage II sporulation protein D
LLSFSIKGQELRVRLYSTQTADVYLFLPDSGGYSLQFEDTKFDLSPDKLVTISMKDDKIKIKAEGKELYARGIVRMEKKDPRSRFRIRVDEDERIYDGDLELRLLEGDLLAINEVNLERYVGGVVESEAGHVRLYEFLKAQAVIARTYALKHKGEHQDKGFDLNDDVDAQAFHSIAYSEHQYMIWRAVYATKNEVIVDEEDELIIAAYHSNSGGQTVNSEDAWSTAVPYLRSTADSFSVGGDHYHWEQEIDRMAYLDFLVSKCGPFLPDTCKEIWLINQNKRIPHIELNEKVLRLKDIRLHFGLPSSFFTMHEDENKLRFQGRGFGHGVGLSQEGAMLMARNGFSYREILNYYYTQIKIIAP